MKVSIVRTLSQGVVALLCLSIFASIHMASASAMQVKSSTNWSGYVAGGHTYNQVVADITMPTVTCTTPGAESLFWVGLDGYNGTIPLEQDGIGAKCSDTGKAAPTYFAWWEMINAKNNASLQTVAAISAGTKVQAEVTYNTSKKYYDLYLYDLSTKKPLLSETVSGDGARQTAEWIAERYTVNKAGSLSPLAKWTGDASMFTDVYAATSSNAKLNSVASYNPTLLMMIDNGVLANPNQLVGSGTSFGVTWMAAE